MSLADGSESPAQKAARERRERRQKKIIQDGKDRLDRITRLNSVKKETPIVENSIIDENELVSDPLFRELVTDINNENLKNSSNGKDIKKTEKISTKISKNSSVEILDNSNGNTNLPSPFPEGSPFNQMFEQMIQGDGNPFGPNGLFSNPDIFTSLQNGDPNIDINSDTGLNNLNENTQTNSIYKGWHWILLHLISNFLLFYYLVKNNSFTGTFIDRSGNYDSKGAFWHFIILQIILQVTQFFLENGNPPSDSKLGQFALFVPQPFSSYLIIAARYTYYFYSIMRDFVFLLVFIGFYVLYRDITAKS